MPSRRVIVRWVLNGTGHAKTVRPVQAVRRFAMYKETLRQVWAEIDMSAFDHNVKEIKRQMKCPNMIGVIKANGYGHGATECAKVLKYNGVDHFVSIQSSSMT